MLAPDGRCKALDAAADGYVRSEAAAALLLRVVDSVSSAAAAAAAAASGATASAEGGGAGLSAGAGAAVLLLGTAVNQDGRSSSLTAPNGPAQQALVRAALAAAALPAARLNLLSLHGTGMSVCVGFDRTTPQVVSHSLLEGSCLLRCTASMLAMQRALHRRTLQGDSFFEADSQSAFLPVLATFHTLLLQPAGTALGDPIEVGAAAAVLGQRRTGGLLGGGGRGYAAGELAALGGAAAVHVCFAPRIGVCHAGGGCCAGRQKPKAAGRLQAAEL
jgi:hypothetical protein